MKEGSYAHVGLPGLRELFATQPKEEVKAMKYGLSNEEAIQAIKSNYPPERYTVLREALDMAMEALQQLTEKDEIIEALRISKEHEIELHAHTCIEKDASIQREYALKHEAYNNLTRCHETMADNAEEIARLRKALKEARNNVGVIDAHGERPWEVTSYCDAAIEAIDAALGEGDKDGN